MRSRHDSRVGNVDRSRLPFWAHVDDVATAMSSRPIRTLIMVALTTIGVASAVGVLGLAQATRVALSDRFLAQRATAVVAKPVESGFEFPDDFEQRLNELSGVRSAAVLDDLGGLNVIAVEKPSVELRVVRAQGSAISALSLHGVGPAFATHGDSEMAGALVGSAAAHQLRLGPVELQPVITISGIPTRVTGVITSSPDQPALLASILVGTDVPLVAEVADSSMTIKVTKGTASFVSSNVDVALAPEHPERVDGTAAYDDSSLRQGIDSDVRNLVLAAAVVVLAAAVLAGGIAASSAVNSRRSEIGLRRVLGARPIHIFVLVLSETVIAGTIGGLSGGWIGAATVLAVAPAGEPLLDPRVVIVAPMLGAVTGALAGLIPAAVATRVSPSAAFRFS